MNVNFKGKNYTLDQFMKTYAISSVDQAKEVIKVLEEKGSLKILSNSQPTNQTVENYSNVSGDDLLSMGVSAKREGKYDVAVELYLKSAEKLPNNSAVFFSLAKTLYIIEKFDDAISCYLKAFQLGKTGIDLYMHLGHALLDANPKNITQMSLVEQYRCSIDPYFDLHGDKKFRNNVSSCEVEHYDDFCISTAQKAIASLR